MPAAGPFIAAITGLGMVRRRTSMGMYSLRSTLPTSSGVRIPPSAVGSSVTSAPEQKARPAPVSTTTRTASSRSACLMASPSCLRVSAPMAFIFSGLLSWINPTPSWTWTMTCSSISVAICLPSFEDCLPLLEKCAHAFLLVLGRKQEVEALALGDQALCQRRLERFQHRLLRHPKRERGLFRELACDSLGDLDGHFGRHHLVDDAELLGPCGRDWRPGEDGLHRRVLAGGSGPSLGAAGAWDDAQVDLRLPEAG